MSDFTFDPKTSRYRDNDSGKFITDRAVREAVDRVADEASARLAALSGRLRSGDVTLATWQREAMATIKDAHLAAGIAAHGGTARMDQHTWGLIGRQIREEYRYLRDLASDIASGRQPLNGRLVARAGMYGQAARSTFSSVLARDQLLRGATLERNILSAAESCASCRAQSALGWVALGTLTPIGARSCMSNCRCRITYSLKAQAAA
jgi:hypothetical protein